MAVAACAADTSAWYPPRLPAFRSAWAFEKSEAAFESSVLALAADNEDEVPDEDGLFDFDFDDGDGVGATVGELGVVVSTPPVLFKVVLSRAFSVAPSVGSIRTCCPSTAMTYFSCGCGIVFDTT